MRSYNGEPGMIGLEPTFEQHLANLVEVFREVRRVLRDDGSLWLNYGDRYWRGGRNNFGWKAKDLMGMPHLVSTALMRDGWWRRQDNIYHKTNPKPTWGADRPQSAFENVFQFSRAPTYYYDRVAVRQRASENTHARRKDGRRDLAKGRDEAFDRYTGYDKRQNTPKDVDGHSARMGREVGWRTRRRVSTPRHEQYTSGDQTLDEIPRGERDLTNVWTMCTGAGFRGAHFATFPTSLVEPCVTTSTSAKGVCGECGAPWKRDVERYRTLDGERKDDIGSMYLPGPDMGCTNSRQGVGHWRLATVHEEKGWSPSCACDADIVPAVVLDPFAGAGTVGLVAEQLGRDAVLIEISREYAEMAQRRLADELGGLFSPTIE